MKTLVSACASALMIVGLSGAAFAGTPPVAEVECDGAGTKGEQYVCLNGERYEVSIRCEDDGDGFSIVLETGLFFGVGGLMLGGDQTAPNCGVLFGTDAEKFEAKCVGEGWEIELEVKAKGPCLY